MVKSPTIEGMVLVMGVTGAGKSYFVNQLKEGSVAEGATMDSCTAKCQIVETSVGETNVAVVDCPGFDDSEKSDTEILSMISELLTNQYSIGMKLCGIVMLQRITDNRFQGKAHEILSIFRQLVGDEALPSVVLATSQWSKVRDEDMEIAKSREQQLRDKYWRDMLDKKAMMFQFTGTKASAEGILAQLIGREHVVLQLQKELVDKKMPLGKTGAGSILKPKVVGKVKDNKKELQRLSEELKNLSNGTNTTKKLRILREISETEVLIEEAEKDEARLGTKVGVDMVEKLKKVDWQRGFQIALSVLSFAINIVTFALGS